jgi:anti-sigma-K factor RskA
VDLHDLTAAYALDALDADEAEAYERHLGECEECREQLAELNDTAATLAFAAVAPAPAPRLRAAILEAAGAERSNVVPFVRRPWVARGLVVAAAAAACIAVGFGVSAFQSGSSHVVAVLKIGPHRGATLQIEGLAAAPRGKTYEAWVIPPGRAPRPAGLFGGGAGTNVIRLRSGVPRHGVVAVTLERAGGVSAPTTPLIIKTST